MQTKMVIFFIMLCCISCTPTQKKRTFVWSEDIKAITSQDLEAWIRKVPFQNEWKPNDGNEDKIVFTNIAQIFPFMGKFKNENDDLNRFRYPDQYFYKEASVVYKDPKWGELFVHGKLLYEPEELYLKSFFSETGSVLFSGSNAIYESYTASLKETYCIGNTKDYKTALYWVNTSSGIDYLLGFYQQGQLVLEIGIPCRFENRAEGISKLQACGKALNLKITEWEKATPNDLIINTQPISFWKNPYYGIYRKRFLPDMDVKINNSPFRRYRRRLASEKGVNYLFAFEDDYGTYELTFTKEKTKLTQEEYQKNKEGIKTLEVSNDTRKIFIMEDNEIENHRHGKAKMYYKNNEILNIHYSYPIANQTMETLIEDILVNIRVRVL